MIQPKTLLQPSMGVLQQCQIQINYETMQIICDGKPIDYANSYITEGGLVTPLQSQPLQIPQQIIHKFHKMAVTHKFCRQISKSLTRMLHSAYLTSQKAKKCQRNSEGSYIQHCLPILKKIPPKTKYIIDIFKYVNIGKIKLLIDNDQTFVVILELCIKALLKSNQQGISPIQVASHYKRSCERVYWMMRNFQINSQFYNFLADINAVMLSKEINQWLNTLLLASQNKEFKKIKKNAEYCKKLGNKLQEMIKIIESTFCLIGTYKKSKQILDQILLVDEVHHWLVSEIEQISKNAKLRPLFIELLSLICTVNLGFISKLYHDKDKVVNYVITIEITSFYQCKNMMNSTPKNRTRQMFRILAEELISNDTQTDSIGLVVMANFIELFEWLQQPEISTISKIIHNHNNKQILKHFLEPLRTQIEAKVRNLATVSIKQLRNKKLQMIEIFKLALFFMKYNHRLISKQMLSQLGSINTHSNNQFISILYKQIMKTHHPSVNN